MSALPPNSTPSVLSLFILIYLSVHYGLLRVFVSTFMSITKTITFFMPKFKFFSTSVIHMIGRTISDPMVLFVRGG